MSTILEVGIEVVAFLAITYVLARIAYASVRIEERSIPNPNKRRTAFTREDDGMARELREEYENHNRTAEYDSGTYISLPSVTSSVIPSGIASFIMTTLVAVFHSAGIAQIGIHGPVSQAVLDDAYFGTALFILPMIMMLFGVFFYWIMSNIAKYHARQYADTRVRKNRRVYIYQRYSMDEKISRRKIERAEKRAEKRARERATERATVRRIASTSNQTNNVIDIRKVV